MRTRSSWHKGTKRNVRGVINEISDTMMNETLHKRELRELREGFKKTVEKPLKPSALERRPGPWRICEFFTMAALLSMVATAMHWEAFEPVSRTAGWDFETPDGRDHLRGYIGRMDPDFYASHFQRVHGPEHRVYAIHIRVGGTARTMQRPGASGVLGGVDSLPDRPGTGCSWC